MSVDVFELKLRGYENQADGSDPVRVYRLGAAFRLDEHPERTHLEWADIMADQVHKTIIEIYKGNIKEMRE